MAVISTNIAANSAVRYLNMNSVDQSSSLAKLASGSRINKASDDAAGLAISTRISSDVTALTQAATNASHGTSILQTADGGASNISDMLQRMKALASQSVSGTVTDSERAYIDAEFSQLAEEIDGISESTRYNGASLLDGTSDFANGMVVVVGSNATSDTIKVTIDALTTSALNITAKTDEAPASLIGSASGYDASGGDVSFTVNGTAVTLSATGGTASDGVYSADDIATAINTALGTSTVSASVDATTGKLTLSNTATGSSAGITIAGTSGFDVAKLGFDDTSSTGRDAGTTLSVATQDGAQAAIDVIDAAIDQVSKARANIGALESRFEFRSNTIATSIENLEAANSAIKDVDVASESATLAAAKVKTQAAVAAAAQANQMPQELLKLLQ